MIGDAPSWEVRMGRFSYGNGLSKVEIEDRGLSHLQHVMGSKLRRGEGFFFTWADDISIGSGRRTVWIHPTADLKFKYHGSRTPSLNREWLEALMQVANSPSGLRLIPEPAEGSPGGSRNRRPHRVTSLSRAPRQTSNSGGGRHWVDEAHAAMKAADFVCRKVHSADTIASSVASSRQRPASSLTSFSRASNVTAHRVEPTGSGCR